MTARLPVWLLTDQTPDPLAEPAPIETVCESCMTTMYDEPRARRSVVGRDDSAKCVECGYELGLVNAVASHPDHNGLRAPHLDGWFCVLCEANADGVRTALAEPEYHSLASASAQVIRGAGVGVTLTRHEGGGNTSTFPVTMTRAQALRFGADILRAASDSLDD